MMKHCARTRAFITPSPVVAFRNSEYYKRLWQYYFYSWLLEGSNERRYFNVFNVFNVQCFKRHPRNVSLLFQSRNMYLNVLNNV